MLVFVFTVGHFPFAYNGSNMKIMLFYIDVWFHFALFNGPPDRDGVPTFGSLTDLSPPLPVEVISIMAI